MATLAEVMAYRNPDVVDRFCDEWDVAREEAEALFDDLLRWLWLCDQHADGQAISEALLAIDEMWHTFVLFTQPYAAFCQHYFGRFIHHAPTTRGERERDQSLWQSDPDAARVRWEERERKQYALIYHQLGEETLLRWYVDLPTRFDEQFFRTARKVKPIAFRPTERLRALRAEGAGG